MAFVEAHPLNQYQLAFLEAVAASSHLGICVLRAGVADHNFWGGQVTKMIEKFRLCEVSDFVSNFSQRHNPRFWVKKRGPSRSGFFKPRAVVGLSPKAPD